MSATKNFLAIVLSLAMALLPFPIGTMANPSYYLTVSTDKQTYNPGEMIYISGSLSDDYGPLPQQIIGIQVDSPNGPFYVNQVLTDDNGNYADSFRLPSTVIYGIYTVYAAYSLGATATCTFEVAPAVPYTLTLNTERNKYGPHNPFNQVVLSGFLTQGGNPVPGVYVGYEVHNPNDSIYTAGQALTLNDGSYTASYTMSPLDLEGIYTVYAAYSGTTTTCTYLYDKSPPTVPSGLSAIAGRNQVQLDWSDVSSPDLQGYRIYRSTSSGTGYTLIADISPPVSAYLDSTATAFTGTYYYLVSAYDDVLNESAPSSEASAIPWGDPTHFLFDQIYSPQTAGVGFSIRIEARDAFEHLVQDYSATALLSDSTGSIQPSSCLFVQGVSNPTVTITRAMTGVEITASVNSISGTSNQFDVLPGALDHVTISPKTATI
ncbi:MAG: hypothetical protein QMD88_08770, partial [Coprothermobacterota bacterium]|nr:hypothetical protein [Coprothermobacterota bacterium]